MKGTAHEKRISRLYMHARGERCHWLCGGVGRLWPGHDDSRAGHFQIGRRSQGRREPPRIFSAIVSKTPDTGPETDRAGPNTRHGCGIKVEITGSGTAKESDPPRQRHVAACAYS